MIAFICIIYITRVYFFLVYFIENRVVCQKVIQSTQRLIISIVFSQNSLFLKKKEKKTEGKCNLEVKSSCLAGSFNVNYMAHSEAIAWELW